MAVEASQLHDPAVELEAAFGEARGAEPEGAGVVIDDAPSRTAERELCRDADDRYPTDVRAESLEPYCLAVRFRAPSGFGPARMLPPARVPMAGARVIRTEALGPCNHVLASTSFELQDESPRGRTRCWIKQSTSSPGWLHNTFVGLTKTFSEEAWVDEFQGHFPGTYAEGQVSTRFPKAGVRRSLNHFDCQDVLTSEIKRAA